MKVLRAAIGLLAVPALVAATPAQAQSLSLGSLSVPLTRFSNLTELITAGSYVAGLAFSVAAMASFKLHKDNPTQLPFGSLAGDAAFAALVHGMSCTVFAGEGTLLGEDACIWTRIGGGVSSRDPAVSNGIDWHAGGQAEIGPGWFLGGAVGVSGSSSQISMGPSGSDRSIDAAIILKRVDGPWFFAGGVAVSTTTQQNIWPVATPGGAVANMTSSSSLLSAGLRLRGAYDVPFQSWYLRPRLDFDLAFTTRSGLYETGPAPALAIDPGSKTAVAFTPALEIGGRVDVAPAIILRPYVAAGASLLPDSSATISGNLGGLPFSGTYYGPNAVAQVEAGLQLYKVAGWEMRMDYRLSAATAFLGQSFGLRAAWHF